MNKLPKLAIVGRPNVGKSALFNRICKKKIAIVDEAEGITRDRLYAETDLFGFKFEVIDTGGINRPSSGALFQKEITKQAEIAIEEADALILVVDATAGITDLDLDVARILLRTKKPVCLAVNKIDNMSQIELTYPFQRLGIKNIVPVSAAQNWQIAELLETVFKNFGKENVHEEAVSGTKVAIVGRPNVGKSSLINYILDEERCIVSPIPGTTRDSIDISFTHDGGQFTFIDTAGIRRKRAEHETVDKFAAIRTARAIERADVCLLLVDAQEGITVQEKKIAGMIEEAGKGCIVLFNKWDLVKGFRMEHCIKSVDDSIPFLKYCPKLMISALSGRNVDKIFGLIQEVEEASKMRISTHQLNKFLETAIQKNHPPMIMGKRLRIYYMAQVDVQPPRFVLFVNYPHLMVDSYQKYLYNQFRDTYGFTGVPILMHLKGKKREEGERHQHAAAQDAVEESLSSDQDEDPSYQSDDSQNDWRESQSQGDQASHDEEDR